MFNFLLDLKLARQELRDDWLLKVKDKRYNKKPHATWIMRYKLTAVLDHIYYHFKVSGVCNY